MPAIGFELVGILLLILANGVFAMAEMALVSAWKARLQEWADAGNTRARAALQLAQHPGEFLATVQIGITIVAWRAPSAGCGSPRPWPTRYALCQASAPTARRSAWGSW
jgi:putative hemolysin